MKKINKAGGLTLSFLLLISTLLSALVIPLPIAKAAPTYSWATYTVAASGDDVELLSYTGWSNYTTDGDNLWVHSNEYTTYAWLRFEGLSAITSVGGVIDQIILGMYSGADVGADYTEVPGGYVSVACPMFSWDFELTEENILAADMNPVASFDGDNLSPSGAWYNKTISNNDPRDWYAWRSDFSDIFTCYVAGFMQYSPDYTYYRSFTSFDEGHPAKLYVKYHTGEGYEEVLSEFGVSSATYDHGWNNYNIWKLPAEEGYPLGPLEYVINLGTTVRYDTIHSLPGTSIAIESGVTTDGTSKSSQRKLARSSDDILYNAYYKDSNSQIYVEASDDEGDTWVNKTRVSTYSGMSTRKQYVPAIAVGYNDSIHVVWHGEASGFNVFRQIWYAEFNGTDWLTPVRLSVYAGMNVQYQSSASISVNYTGTIHVTWSGENTAGNDPDIWYSFRNETSLWSHPLKISTLAGMNSQNQQDPSLAFDGDGDLHVTWQGIATGVTQPQIWHREYNSSWGSISRVSTLAGGDAKEQIVSCILTDWENDPHVVWCGKAVGFGNYEIWYNENNGSWGTPVRISTYPDMDDYPQIFPSITGNSTDSMHVTWQGKAQNYTANDVAWYAEKNNSWVTPEVIQTGTSYGPNTRWARWPAREWARNETYVATAPNGTVITPVPFDTAEEAQEAAEDWDDLYGPVLAISIANIDALEWVFEGNKRYEFTVEYINVNLTEINQVGVGFRDSQNHYHSVWYDRAANTLTVTSPEDGISGWLHSISQAGEVHTGINVTAVFHIMFNYPIPDSYSVSAYSRIVDTADSGWIDGSGWGGGFIFNIYNLGGLSTLTSSGVAGRVTGGDVFEIYAADTRTNIAGTEYFDVRDDPLSWYNVLTNEDLLIDEMPPDWDFNIPRRTQSVTIRLTNNLPEDRAAPEARTYVVPGTDDMAYVSYPFSMRLLSDPFLTGDYQIDAELTLPRSLTSADGILCVQAYMMNPNTTTTTGAFWVRDGPRLEGETKILSDVQFNGNGSWVSYNSTAAAWLYYGAYTAYTWYNVTVAIDLSAAIYDIFIDDAEVVSDLPYRNPAATNAHIVAFSQFVPTAGAPGNSFTDFYVDNVRQWTDFDADYGGAAEATMLFKQLQHWSMDFDFFIENGVEYAQGPTATPALAADDYSDHGYIELGWDVMLNETWINDFLVARINITDGQISGKNDWINFNVTWYYQGVYVKNDLLYGLFEGYSLFPGSSKDTSGFHMDFWFNRANASTLVGARVNTEYFGMSDESVWWAVWSSKWQPMRTEVSDSTIFVDLEDANATIHSAKDVLFVRSSVKVFRTSDSTFAYKVLNIAGLDFRVAIDTMSGVDTPPVRETKVPDVMSGFLGSALGGIFSAALKRLGNTLSGFGMGLFSMSIEFVDNIFAALGYPALVSTIFGWMDSLFSNVPVLVGYGITMIGQVFNLINVSAGNTLTQLTVIITIWVNMYGSMMDMLNGVLTPGLNLWRDLGITSFIQIAAILYPLWLIIMGADKGLQAVMDHIMGVLNIGSFFLNFILNVAGFFMSLLTGLIGAIRG